MDIKQFNHDLFHFLDNSPTPYHAVKNQIQTLEAHGFEALLESENWQLEAGHRYFVSRNGSSLIAFTYGEEDTPEHSLERTGIRIIAAHTDSPCLKVKPNAELVKHSYLQLGVEVYGGVLLNPWFDRDLSLAGKVVYQDKQQAVKSCLLDFKKAIAYIPSLAIHLDKEANKNRSINAQTDIPPVLMQVNEQQHDLKSHAKNSLKDILKEQLKNQYEHINIDTVIDFELSFYDTQKTSYVGLKEEFIASSRLDNLLSCYIGLQALLSANKKRTQLLCCTDHEEVGSASHSGAQGSFLKSVLDRLNNSSKSITPILDHSMLISADNAHAIHPNFSDKHDANHGPLINHGPVIKMNSNQRYASNCETSAVFKILANKAGVPVQNFVVRTDMGCGSTIGPIIATQLGIKTVDVGVPTFAMHSIRELCGSRDSWSLFKVMEQFFNINNEINIPI